MTDIYTTSVKRNSNRTEATLINHVYHFSEIANNKNCADALIACAEHFDTFNQFIDFVNLYAQNEFAYTFKKKSYYFNELPAQMKANIRYFIKISR